MGGRSFSILLILALGLRPSQAAFGAASLEPLRYEQETLANGLRVIYAPLPTAPLVHVRMIYHVGSRDERPERQGLAHLLEHMMYRGSAHVPDGEFVRLVRSVGASYNGVTEPDITSYFETLPRNQLALALYLEADRMAGFAIADDVLSVERNVVLQELLRRADEPETAVSDEMPGQIFRSGPYRWSPGGNAEHVNAATPEELREFFRRFYIPNNAVLVISGDFDQAPAREMVRRLFEWIPRGAEVVRQTPPQPPQTARHDAEIVMAIPEPMVLAGFRTPTYGSDDEAAMLLLTTAARRRLHDNAVGNNHPECSSAFSTMARLEQDGYTYIGAELLSGGDLAVVRGMLNSTFQRLREDGIMLDERDFSGVVWNVCSDILAERQTAEGLAGQIGRGAVLCGQPDASDRLLARLRALTAPKVFPVAEKYFQPELLNFVVVHPGPLTRGEPPANVAKTSPPAAADAARARQVAIPADYPATPPLATDVIPFQVATAQEFEVDGLHVSLLPGISPGRMDLQFVLPRGAQNDPAGMDGLGRLTMNLVLAMAERPQRNPDVGTWTHFPLSYGSSHETDRTQVWIVSPSDQADHLMHEINDSMCWPLETGFFEDYLVYLKWRNFNTLKTEDQRGRPVADLDLRRSLFADSFLGRRINPASLRSISRAQLELCRTYLFDLHGATLIMSADLKVDQVKAMLAIMREGWPSPPRSWPAAPTMGTPGPEGGMRIVLVDDPEAHQSAIRIGARAFADGSDEAPAGDLAEWILNQRIWRVVRADQGYAYVVNSGFDQFRDGGMFAVRTETGIERTGQTTVELLNRIREIAQQEVTASELSDAKIAYTGRFVTGLRTAQEQAAWRAFARQRGEVDDVLRRIAQAQEVVPTQIRELFAKYARDDRLSMVIVGPAALVKPQVESLGPVEVRPMPALRPGAATRPAWQEIPRPM